MTRNQIVGGVGGAVLGVAGAAIINGGLASPWALLGTRSSPRAAGYFHLGCIL